MGFDNSKRMARLQEYIKEETKKEFEAKLQAKRRRHAEKQKHLLSTSAHSSKSMLQNRHRRPARRNAVLCNLQNESLESLHDSTLKSSSSSSSLDFSSSQQHDEFAE